MIITLCGSTRFKDKFEEVERGLTLDGHIILRPGVFAQADEIELTTEQKIQLDNLHRQKINMSDAIFVINVDKYIGESTYGEIDWAQKMEKKIFFLEPMEEQKDEETETDTEIKE